MTVTEPVDHAPGLLRVVVVSAALGVVLTAVLVTVWIVLARLRPDGSLGVGLILAWVVASLLVIAAWAVRTARLIRRRGLRRTKAWLLAALVFVGPTLLFVTL